MKVILTRPYCFAVKAPASSARLATALVLQGRLACRRESYIEMEHAVREATQLYVHLKDSAGLVAALRGRAIAAGRRGRPERAVELAAAAAAALADAPDPPQTPD